MPSTNWGECFAVDFVSMREFAVQLHKSHHKTDFYKLKGLKVLESALNKLHINSSSILLRRVLLEEQYRKKQNDYVEIIDMVRTRISHEQTIINLNTIASLLNCGILIQGEFDEEQTTALNEMTALLYRNGCRVSKHCIGLMVAEQYLNHPERVYQIGAVLVNFNQAHSYNENPTDELREDLDAQVSELYANSVPSIAMDLPTYDEVVAPPSYDEALEQDLLSPAPVFTLSSLPPPAYTN